MPFTATTFHTNGIDIHAMVSGNTDAPVMVMLHGFPEYWAAWSTVAQQLSNRYRTILPDQRGYNLSTRPSEPDAYHVRHLVADMVGLIDQVSPDKPVILCGHDWGASVAYAVAMRHAERISHLIIANGVHPMCFQKALFAAGPQTAASQYMNVLRTKDSEAMLSANNFEKLMGMMKKFSSAPWLDDSAEAAYRNVWSQPGALSAMLNWYRGSPMVVPATGEPARQFPLTADMAQKYRIIMPHLLLWGEQDTALLKESRADLDHFCDDLTVKEKSDGSHWILHEHPEWVAGQISRFLDQHPIR